MASRDAIATMDAEIRNRFRLVTGRLSKRLGVDPPAAPATARQPDLARVYELQTVVEWLERLDSTAKDEGYSAKTEAAPVIDTDLAAGAKSAPRKRA